MYSVKLLSTTLLGNSIQGSQIKLITEWINKRHKVVYLCMECRQNTKKYKGADRAGVIYCILTKINRFGRNDKANEGLWLVGQSLALFNWHDNLLEIWQIVRKESFLILPPEIDFCGTNMWLGLLWGTHVACIHG